MKFKSFLTIGLGLLSIGIFLPNSTQLVYAQHGCPADRPCFNYGYPQKSGNNIIFKFNQNNENHEQWEYYNVRYKEQQFENRSGTFTITNVAPHTNHKLTVQGCNKNFLKYLLFFFRSDREIQIFLNRRFNIIRHQYLFT